VPLSHPPDRVIPDRRPDPAGGGGPDRTRRPDGRSRARFLVAQAVDAGGRCGLRLAHPAHRRGRRHPGWVAGQG